MKIKSGFELRDVCGENVVVAHGKENIDFSKIISLNESAAYLWNLVQDKEFDADFLTRALLDEYEVDEQTARQDVIQIMDSWKEAGLAE